MKVGIIGTVGLPAKYGGFETLAEHLTAQKEKEFDFIVYCSSLAYPNKKPQHNGAKLIYIPFKANGIQSILYDIWCILDSVRKCDKLLILGVSGCIILPFIKAFSKKEIFVNIDGLEWKRDKWGTWARRFLKFSEKIAVNNADAIIADNKIIQDHVRIRYGKKAHLIAYGGDHCQKVELTNETIIEFPFLKQDYAFKVCRIEPENNIELILKAFRKYKNINLVIVGNWNHSAYSRSLKCTFNGIDNLYLLDPIYDQKKLNQIRSNCLIYIHGHSAGGTNPSLVEAMNLRLPIMAFGINYNKETTGAKAIYYYNEVSLVKALENLQNEDLKAIGDEMFKIASENYTWKTIAEKYQNILTQI